MRSFLSFIWSTLKKIDFYLLALILTASFYGVLLIFSATNSFGTLKLVIIQSGAVVAGLFAICILLMIDYKNLSKFSIYIYGLCVILLVATLLFGKEVQGNKNWIELGPINVQPSEFVKIYKLAPGAYPVIITLWRDFNTCFVGRRFRDKPCIYLYLYYNAVCSRPALAVLCLGRCCGYRGSPVCF